ncbi:MAG: response regulator transcription factor [Clostridia bacterium]|nr:response regulator transcription factor [Clostridia bacterium]
MRILVVEDEERLAEALGEIMKSQRYTVDIVHDGESGYDYAMSGIYDAIILDVLLPKMDGFEVVRNMRAAHNTTPVIMLTARDGTEDKIKGLDCGADDYLTKPFIPGELLARVRAVSRRQGEVVLNELQFEDVKLDLSNYTLRTEQRSINLGPKEFDIMRMLMFSPNVIVPKEDILVKVWGTESDAEDNNVEVYISFLRKKLKHLTSHVQIATIRRIGYRLEVNPDC